MVLFLENEDAKNVSFSAWVLWGSKAIKYQSLNVAEMCMCVACTAYLFIDSWNFNREERLWFYSHHRFNWQVFLGDVTEGLTFMSGMKRQRSHLSWKHHAGEPAGCLWEGRRPSFREKEYSCGRCRKTKFPAYPFVLLPDFPKYIARHWAL